MNYNEPTNVKSATSLLKIKVKLFDLITELASKLNQ